MATAAVALALGLPGLVGAPAGAATPTVRLNGASAPSLPAAAVRLGPLASSTRVPVDVTLKSRNAAGLLAFVSRTDHPRLRPAAFAARFGASTAAVAGVEALLRRAGFTRVQAAPDRLAVDAVGSAAQVDRAFSVPLERYRVAARTVFANTSAPVLPASLASVVQDIVGLDDVQRTHSLLQRVAVTGQPVATRTSTTGPTPCAAATAQSGGSYSADQLASHYGMTPLYALGDLGQGVHIGLVEFEPNLPGDVNAYAKCYGITPKVNYVPVDGGSGTGAGSAEAALDIEDVIGLAPDATVDVYQAPTSGSDQATLGVYQTIVDDDVDQVVSSSWGQCEQGESKAFAASEQTLFEQAAAQGQTIVAAAGDDGSTDCFGELNGSAGTSLAVDDPASQPFVVSVGGTTIGSGADSVWNDSATGNGAGGGGLSLRWCMPSYQDTAAIPSLDNSGSAACKTGTGLAREVPDVAADADPYTGYVIDYQGSWQGGIGGTSAAAPLWAAAGALVDASPFCSAWGSHDPGVSPAALYGAAAGGSYQALRDVTLGNNDYTDSGYGGGMYAAGTGFDEASGLGTPQLSGVAPGGAPSTFFPGLAALICWHAATTGTSPTITGVSPATAATGAPTTVTITGTGFLPVPGADQLVAGSETVTASCSSSTACTAVLPAGQTGTVGLQMDVEDLAESPVGAHFSFGAAPAVTVTSPSLPEDLSPTSTVRYTATDAASPVATYDVRYRTLAWNGKLYSAYRYPSGWQATVATSETLTVAPGTEYCYGVRATSAAGVTSAWSPDRCTAAPLPRSALHVAGAAWAARADGAFFGAGALTARRSGATLALPGAVAGHIALVVEGCRGCGTVRVTIGRTVVGTAPTGRAATVARLVLPLPPLPRRVGTITLTVTSTGKPVVIEGVAVY